MDDESCAVKYTEIVPLHNFNDCSDITKIKQELVSMKVTEIFCYSVTDLG